VLSEVLLILGEEGDSTEANGGAASHDGQSKNEECGYLNSAHG
jgi:hypothetical protein